MYWNCGIRAITSAAAGPQPSGQSTRAAMKVITSAAAANAIEMSRSVSHPVGLFRSPTGSDSTASTT